MGFAVLIYEATCDGPCGRTEEGMVGESIPDFERRLEGEGWSLAGDSRDRKTFCPSCGDS